MSAVTLQPAARRRANFVGGIHTSTSDHDGSYQHLRAELGEENTNRLITNIGTLAMASGITASGVSLSDAVKRIIGSLTPAERSSIASGGAPPPRVQALLDSEIKAAQQQQQAQRAASSQDGTGSLEQHEQQLARRAEMLRAAGIMNADRAGTLGSGRESIGERILMDSARAEAARLGMPWAADNADLLRLGPSAIKALADIQIHQQSYDRLTKEAGVSASDAVTFARRLKKKGITDGNAAFNAVAAATNLGQTPAEKNEIFQAISDATPADASPDAKRRYEEVRRRYEGRPGGKEAFDRVEQETRIVREAEQTATVRTQIAATGLDSLDAIAATATPRTGQPTTTQRTEAPAANPAAASTATPPAATTAGTAPAPAATPPATPAANTQAAENKADKKPIAVASNGRAAGPV